MGYDDGFNLSNILELGCSSTCSLIQHSKGTAFIMKNGKPLALNIDSRVAVNAALFHEIIPNYHRPRVSDCWEDTLIIRGISLKEEERREELEKFKANGKDQHLITKDKYLIYYPMCAVGDLDLLFLVTTARLSSNKDVVFNNFIKGKGQGLNVLFYGVPGVGKIFIVKVTTERFQTPLYLVSAGELIVDHADVFIKKRALYQGSHNRLVTIFLRKLKYYEGVLFLTTNRVMEFNKAESFLLGARTLQGPATINPSELEHLALIKLNSQEIKNLSSIAQALAFVKNTQVSFMHLVKAMKANDKFVEEFENSGHMQGMYT
ncbi:hypothetical protein BDV06DRAFT_217475 [Aspergillus oleicola]